MTQSQRLYMIDWLELVKRILRYKNYMLALVHKNILPLEHRVPFLGDVIFFSEGLKFNIEWILFGTYLTNPWAPFSSFQLKRKSLPCRYRPICGKLIQYFYEI